MTTLATNELQGQVSLITGSSRTLGAEIARQMAACGVHVALNYHRSGDAAEALAQECRAMGVEAIPFQADVSRPEEVERLVSDVLDTFNHIDILINNVGPYVDTPFMGLPIEDFDRILAGNVRATFLMSQAVGKHMLERGHGHIINIAATDYKNRSHSIYGLAKGGVVHLTEAMALELAPAVRVNAIAPDLLADNDDFPSETFLQQAIDATPMGQLVTRAEVARMVTFLCTSPFNSITGQTIVLDGGRSIPRINNGKVNLG